MNDDELKRLLQNTLSGRRAPEGARSRILASLRPGRRRGIAAAAAALVLVAGAAWLIRPRAVEMPDFVRLAIEHHADPDQHGREATAATPREIAETVSEATGREVELPGLRDGGFVYVKPYRCQTLNCAHVVYSNSWLKASCFVFDASRLDLARAIRFADPGVEAYSFSTGRYSATAVREGGVIKLWVAELRPDQLASIAVDAEQKRHQVKKTVLAVPDRAMSGPLGGIMSQTAGVEDVQMEPSRNEATVWYDGRRFSPLQIEALLLVHGIAAHPRDGGGR